MQLSQLAHVVAVATHGGFTRAAESLQIAQPSLSQSIRALEAELGTPLFHRGRGGVTLTPAGELLLPAAKRILADLDAARHEVAALSSLRAGSVRLGATPSLCTGVLPSVLAAFHADYPNISVTLQEGGSRTLVRAMAEGDLDLALVILPLARDEPGLDTRPMWTESLVVAAREPLLGDPAAGPVPLAALRDVPMVTFRAGYDLQASLQGACARAGFEPTVVVAGAEMDSVVALAKAGLGAALLPVSVAARDDLLTYELADPSMTRTIGLATPHGLTPSAVVAELVDRLGTWPMPEGIAPLSPEMSGPGA